MAPIPPYPKKDYNILSTLWICCQDDEWDKLRRLVTILCPHRIDYIMQYIPKTEVEKAWILLLPEPPRRHLRFWERQGRQVLKTLCASASVGGSRFAGIPLSSQAFEHAKTNLSWLCRNHVDLDTLVTTYDLNPAFLIQACLELQLRLPPALSRELFWRYLAELLDHDYYNCIPLASIKSVVRYLDAYNPHMAFNPNDDPEGIAACLSALRQSVDTGVPSPPPPPAPSYDIMIMPYGVARRNHRGMPNLLASGLHTATCVVPELDCALLHALLHWGPSAGGHLVRVLSSDLHFVWGVNGACRDGVGGALYGVLHEVCADHGIELRAAWIPSMWGSMVYRRADACMDGARYSSELADDLIKRCACNEDRTVNVAGHNLKRWLKPKTDDELAKETSCRHIGPWA